MCFLCLFNVSGHDDRELFNKIKKGKFDIPSYVTPEAKNLLQKILKVNPDDRLKVNEVIKLHIWVI